MSFRGKSRAVALHGVLAWVCLTLSGCMLPGHTSHGGDEVWPMGLLVVGILATILWFLCRRR
jgi:hypothetical protein